MSTDWYKQKTKELNSVIKELRAFDPIKKIEDDYKDQFDKCFNEMILFGGYTFHVYNNFGGIKSIIQ